MDRRFTMHRPAGARWTGRALAAAPAARRLGERRGLAAAGETPPTKVPEVGGPEGPEPTRYGDWERKGICYDF